MDINKLNINPKWIEKIDTITSILSHYAELSIYLGHSLKHSSSKPSSSEFLIYSIDDEILNCVDSYLANRDIQVPSLTNFIITSFISRGMIRLEEKKGKIFNQYKDELLLMGKIRREVMGGLYHLPTITEKIKSFMDKAAIPSTILNLIELDHKDYEEKLAKLIKESPNHDTDARDIVHVIASLAIDKNGGESIRKGDIIGYCTSFAKEKDLRLLYSYLKKNIPNNKEIRIYLDSIIKKVE